MSTKHVGFHPGPWFVSPGDDDGEQWRISLSDDCGCRGNEYMSVSGVCRRADALLMADAPALYDRVEALERLLTMIDGELAEPALLAVAIPRLRRWIGLALTGDKATVVARARAARARRGPARALSGAGEAGMRTKHEGFTPGPWKVSHHACNTHVVDENGTAVAAALIAGGANYHANAALIADAPALYEENVRLREVLAEIWASVPATYDHNDPVVKRHAHALNAIPAALNGEAS